jgi:AraC-like DNA-binding protein/catechol 2,3-dioxygenase-like lactoylglutathione lyase family enzyme
MPTPPSPGLRRARDLADRRYFEAIDVAALSRTAGLSRAYFIRQFHRSFGVTPHQYLTARRMERAVDLLRTTDRSVTGICSLLGLQSIGSFTSLFSRTLGVSPTVYRAFHPGAAARARISHASCEVRTAKRAPSKKSRSRRRSTVRAARWSWKKAMSIKLTHVTVWVRDQEEACSFYTEKLGMELRDDVTVPLEADDARWLTVGPPGQPEVAFVLSDDPPAAEAGRGESEFHLSTEDCWASYVELRERGVEFDESPTKQTYGIHATFHDPSGNVFWLVEPSTG